MLLLSSEWFLKSALFVGFLIAALYWVGLAHLKSLLREKTDRRNARIILAGISGSGKTQLWQTLVSGDAGAGAGVQTVPSLRVRVENFVPTFSSCPQLESAQQLFGNVEIADTPGDWARDAELLPFTPNACAVIFCVDATALPAIRESAAYLFAILDSSAWRRRPLALCLYFSRTELAGAQPAARLREDLEREVERLRRAKAGGPALIPLAPSGALWRALERAPGGRRLRALWRRWAKAREPPSNLPAGFFRFQSLSLPCFTFLHEPAPARRADNCKAFIQRAAIMYRTYTI